MPLTSTVWKQLQKNKDDVTIYSQQDLFLPCYIGTVRRELTHHLEDALPRPVSEEWMEVREMHFHNGGQLQQCSPCPPDKVTFTITRLISLFVAGIAVYPAQAKEHTRPGGEDTATGSGQRREDHLAKAAGI